MTVNSPTILSKNEFPVVGIGASAGGLEAFKKLVTAITPTSGMAYVLVQHLDPTHDSLLSELLQKVTKLPVLEITDEIKVLPDHIYIIPSNCMLTANDGVLLLSKRPEKAARKLNMPIDLFFASLAEAHQKHAIGIVLSGTGKDGTKGLQAIKEHGGTTIVQDVASAAYKGMPEYAITAGVADFIVAPEAIPLKLLALEAESLLNSKRQPVAKQSDEAAYSSIMSLLNIGNGNDFTFYKQTTIRRRIARRMALGNIQKIDAYQLFLLDNKKEQDALYLDLLIPVTSFFRDQEIFQIISKTVFPEIIKAKAAGTAMRIWVAGCSTGQEAYSLAICFKEILGDSEGQVQIFATDISAPSIATARKGIFSKTDLTGVGQVRLKAFFTETNGSFQVKKSVRDMCVFALHSFVKDPPFSKMDFVSCRNVLIYMEPYLQQKALTAFHYALNPNGFLLLGKSETEKSMPELFASFEKKAKLFTRRQVPARFQHVASERPERPLPISREKISKVAASFEKAADEVVLSNYMPAGVVVNDLLDIVQFRGDTSRFLQQAPGKPTHNLLKMAEKGMAFELQNTFLRVKKELSTVHRDNIVVKIQGRLHHVSIDFIPLAEILEPHYLVLFRDEFGPANSALANAADGDKKTARKKDIKSQQIAQLEKEIAESREDMWHISEEQEAANEELQSANEEYLSGTEELQSLNEELETSKEELQSSNEELTSLVEQVTTAWHYAEAIITTMHEPLLVLDKNLHVKKANLAFYKVFNLKPETTENYLIYDLNHKQWNIPLLHTALDEMLPNKTTITAFEMVVDFPATGERILHLNATEILRDKKDEKLILLSINDVTEKVRHDTKQKEFSRELELIVQKRTIELSDANQMLLEKNDTLLVINEELEIFNYIASHDLQEPVRKIKTFANLISEREYANLSQDGKNYLTRMVDAASRLQILLRDLTTYSKAGNKELSLEKTSLNTIVEDVLNELQENIQESNAVIDVGLLCEVPVIPFQMRQLFNNLLFNSLKFTKPGIPPTISIRSEMISGSQLINQLQKDKQYCHIIFADEGIGFEQQYEKRIFRVFQQLNKKNEYPGTGIGLSIVKKVVDNHHGLIAVTSQVGVGTTFDIYLPVNKAS